MCYIMLQFHEISLNVFNIFQKWRDVSHTGAAQNGDRPRPFLALLRRKWPHIRGTS